MAHESHKTRMSDSSLYDEVCINCNKTDTSPLGLDTPCPSPKATFNHGTSHTYGKADFWKQHESALRAGRITQAAAIIFAGPRFSLEEAVTRAFMIDQEVQNKIKQEKA